uniref:Uncharacterized protein n=1 Tax=Timema shepardi TaxID=629360 RepID=A0A7R9B3S7_TIMSH|nr:unnamed protein product [Timema shepardi]
MRRAKSLGWEVIDGGLRVLVLQGVFLEDIRSVPGELLMAASKVVKPRNVSQSGETLHWKDTRKQKNVSEPVQQSAPVVKLQAHGEDTEQDDWKERTQNRMTGRRGHRTGWVEGEDTEQDGWKERTQNRMTGRRGHRTG